MTTNVIDLKKKTFKEDLIEMFDRYNIGEFVVIAEQDESHEVHIRSLGGTNLVALMEITKQQFISEVLDKRKEAML
jgi:hypothetical protein